MRRYSAEDAPVPTSQLMLILRIVKKLSVNSASMAGGPVRASAGPPSQRSAQGEPRPVARGPSGSTCAAHNHTRARAHARARPRCTLQNKFAWHCTCTTHAHFCISFTPRSITCIALTCCSRAVRVRRWLRSRQMHLFHLRRMPFIREELFEFPTQIWCMCDLAVDC